MAIRKDVLLLAARDSLSNYLATYPPRIFLVSVLPRTLLQVFFFSTVAMAAAGTAARSYAFVGASVQVMVLVTVVKAPDVLLDERPMGTMYRHRLGVVGLSPVIVTRWWVYAAEGVLDSLIAATLVGLAFGLPRLVTGMLVATPLLVLISLSTSAFGICVAVAAMAIGRAETNIGGYLLLALCGVVAPLSELGAPLAAVARVLPLTNGLLAIRAALSGSPWLGYALTEILVGALWLAIGLTSMGAYDRRVRRIGVADSD